jgi:hypothetical protein
VTVFSFLISAGGYAVPPNSDAKKSSPVPLAMKVTVSQPKPGEWVLDVQLTNQSSKPLTVYQHSLPWEGWDSMILIAVKADALGTRLEHPLPIDDPGPTKITIKPEETRKGTISLVKRFPNLAEALKARDVILFWSYQLEPIDAKPLDRMGGWLLIRKQP